MLIRCLHETLVEQFPPTWTLYCSTLWFRHFATTEHYLKIITINPFPKNVTYWTTNMEERITVFQRTVPERATSELKKEIAVS